MRWLVIALTLFPCVAVACLHDCVPDDRLYRITRHYEGLRLFAYKDVAGHETLGFGHMLRPSEAIKEPITGEQAEALLEADEQEAVSGVNHAVSFPLNVSQFDALADFSYNLGLGTLGKSTLLRMINAGDTDVSAQFYKYDKARVNGVLEIFQGLYSRRQAEAELYDN